ncbi:c-type cytochrome [Mameliella sediminis]|uniref:c-type cytochrome n=1 Tax=Mameliella sediminis TaxID=2836866 RepID=UPI001C4419B1|nr:cytochrome c [Mameliella sediminis]MBV7394006.1 cytochrome c [Mameliella sediminis]
MYFKALASVALIAATACTPFWDARTGASRSWFSPSAEAVEPEPGARIYAANCAYCHGASGQGDGALGADLPVPPPDLTRLSSANGGIFPAERVLETIHGYPGKFHRGSMPEFRDELSSPVVEWRAPSGEVIMTPKGLLDVLTYVEALQETGDG